MKIMVVGHQKKMSINTNEQVRKYWEKKFKDEIGRLDADDKEVLEATICFEITSNKIANLF